MWFNSLAAQAGMSNLGTTPSTNTDKKEQACKMRYKVTKVTKVTVEAAQLTEKTTGWSNAWLHFALQKCDETDTWYY